MHDHEPPISSPELPETLQSPRDLDDELATEAARRIALLRYATGEEIADCIDNTEPNSLSRKYFVAFESNPLPRIPKKQVEQIISEHGCSHGSSTKRMSMNKSRILRDRDLEISAEKIFPKDEVIAWVLQTTRIKVTYLHGIPPAVKALHDKAATISASLEEPSATLLNHFLRQYIGIPLDQLSQLSGEPVDELEYLIYCLNTTHLYGHRIGITIRNGIAILAEVSAERRPDIIVVNNPETRRNLKTPAASAEPVTTTPSETATPTLLDLQRKIDQLTAENERLRARMARSKLNERITINIYEKHLKLLEERLEYVKAQRNSLSEEVLRLHELTMKLRRLPKGTTPHSDTNHTILHLRRKLEKATAERNIYEAEVYRLRAEIDRLRTLPRT